MIKGNALSSEFKKYDQVEKSHSYRLAEHRKDEFDDSYRIATLDIAPFLRGDVKGMARFSEDFASALHEIGFAVLVGHGVDPLLYEEMHELVGDLFETTPLEEKMAFEAKRHGSVSQGYFPMEQTSLIHPDLVEGWLWCRRAFDVSQRRSQPFCTANYWPREDYERKFRKLVLAHERLFKPIARAMLQGIGCNPSLLDQKLAGTNFGLRLNYYPQMTTEQDQSGAGRLLGHEDVDLFTLLPASPIGGLQVWNHESSKWVRLSPPAGSLIINTGDYMQRLSNDVLRSTTHRVGKPTDGSHLLRARTSFATNVYLWEDEMLEVFHGLGRPKYEPIRAIDFHVKSTAKFYGDDYAS